MRMEILEISMTAMATARLLKPISRQAPPQLLRLWSFSSNDTADFRRSPLYAASALAANSFSRSSFAAAFPLFGNQSELYDLPS